MLKLPGFMINTAQIPRNKPIISINKRVFFAANSGPVTPINPREMIWTITNNQDFQTVFFV